jgi:uncharacterized protein (DUF4415 family)
MKKKEKNTVKLSLNTGNPPPLTEEQRAELEALASKPDDAIDYTDMGPLDDDFWKNAARSPFHKPLKQQLTVRLDADVIAWMKAKGRGYQTKINKILRAAMLDELKK